FRHCRVWRRNWSVTDWCGGLRRRCAQSRRGRTYSDDDDSRSGVNRIARAVCVADRFREGLTTKSQIDAEKRVEILAARFFYWYASACFSSRSRSRSTHSTPEACVPSLLLVHASDTLQILSTNTQMKICPVCNRRYPDSMTLCSAEAAVLQRLEDPLIGQTLAGKYRIEKLIKTGGMGAVYRGKHVLMDKTVAIKVLRPSLAGDDAVVARFSREAKAASKISHPHAVSVTDFGEAENGVVFLVMEYLDGRTLKEV